jgi:ATP-dependent RNA helicase RhlE
LSSEDQRESSPPGFAELGLGREILVDVQKLGFTEPTPIQVDAIPVVLGGKDMIGIAQTGTGKTAAFVLPLIQRLEPGRGPRALVLSPTRELTEQIYLAVCQMGQERGYRAAKIIGGESFGVQSRDLGADPDMIVGTPGRVLDQMQRGAIDGRKFEALVLDEADRLLDMGFAPQIDDIIRCLPRERQTLLFSATMPAGIQALARAYMVDPVEVSVGPRHQAVDRCVQELYVSSQGEKITLLKYLLRMEEGSVLVFTRTKRGADQVYRSIRAGGHSATVLHADRRQEERQRAMQGFRDGTYRILVATDIASRGLDVEDIARVVNFDVPPTVEDYLHRIGRTARAQRTGHASTFSTFDDLGALRSIEDGLKAKIPLIPIPRETLKTFAREEAEREHRLREERGGHGHEDETRDSRPRRRGGSRGSSRSGGRQRGSGGGEPRRSNRTAERPEPGAVRSSSGEKETSRGDEGSSRRRSRRRRSRASRLA